jgi:hypothetical protein
MSKFALTTEETKFLRLALDCNAQPGESQNFFLFLLGSLRDRGVNSYEIEEALEDSFSSLNTWGTFREQTGETRMPFGKYQGVPLHSVPKDYLEFLLRNNRAGRIKTRIEIWLGKSQVD